MDEVAATAATAAADPETQSKILSFLEQFWTFAAVSIAVAFGGVAAKRIVAVFVPEDRVVEAAETGAPYRSTATAVALDPKLPLWYRLWRASISVHPVVVGGLCGLIPGIPIANWVPSSDTAARMLWFALAGALSGQVFEMGKRGKEIALALIRQRLGVTLPTSASEPAEPALADKLEPEPAPTKE